MWDGACDEKRKNVKELAIEILLRLKVLAIIYTFAEIIFDYFSMLYNEENKQLSVGHSVH